MLEDCMASDWYSVQSDGVRVLNVFLPNNDLYERGDIVDKNTVYKIGEHGFKIKKRVQAIAFSNLVK